MASLGGGLSARYSVGGLLTSTVLVLTFFTLSRRTVGRSGILHSTFSSRHPRNIAPLTTVMMTSLTSYTFTCSLLNTVM